MAKQFGENIAKRVRQGVVIVTSGEWRLLVSSGSTNYPDRTHVRLQAKGKVGNTVAVEYINGTTINGVDYTFASSSTLPGSVKNSTQFRGTSTWVEPVGDKVQIWARMDNKAAATENSVKVVVTEFA